MDELNTQPTPTPTKRKYTRKEGVALGRPKKAPSSPVAKPTKEAEVAPFMLEIMAILTCPDAGEDAKVAALMAYRFCKGLKVGT